MPSDSNEPLLNSGSHGEQNDVHFLDRSGPQQNHESIRQSQSSMTRKNKISLATTYVAMFLFFLASFPNYKVLDQYVSRALTEHYNLTNLKRNREDCLSGNNSWYTERQNKIQSEAAQQMILVNLAGLVPQFIITFLLGPCSDHIGRKLALLLPPVGGCLRAAIYVVVVYFKLPYPYMCIGSFVEACFGGVPLFFTACVASIADATTLERRSFWICILDLAMSVANVIANVSSGYIIELLGFEWMFVVLAGAYAGRYFTLI